MNAASGDLPPPHPEKQAITRARFYGTVLALVLAVWGLQAEIKISVASGQTTARLCTARGWQ